MKPAPSNFSHINSLFVVIYSMMLFMLTGCGGGSDAPAPAFTAAKLAGATFAYSSSSGVTGTLVFSPDGSWKTDLGASRFIGTWSVVNGQLVCVTTVGGNHTSTYTLVNSITNEMDVSVVEVDPANQTNPYSYTATFKTNTLATVVAPGTFVLNVTFKNLPNSLPQTASTTPNYTITPKRRQWEAMVPF